MGTVATSPVERVVLRDISWDLYQHLIRELGDAPGTRVTYDGGLLQIMVVSLAHDNPNRLLSSIVEKVADQLGIDFSPNGSTTLQRPDLLKGFEPDSCFYFKHAERMRGRDEIDLLHDPAPELVIEVDVTSYSLNRFPIFAAVGVPEVWRHAAGSVSMYGLRDGQYQPIPRSLALPILTPEAVTHFLAAARRIPRPVWVKELSEWVRQQQD